MILDLSTIPTTTLPSQSANGPKASGPSSDLILSLRPHPKLSSKLIIKSTSSSSQSSTSSSKDRQKTLESIEKIIKGFSKTHHSKDNNNNKNNNNSVVLVGVYCVSKDMGRVFGGEFTLTDFEDAPSFQINHHKSQSEQRGATGDDDDDGNSGETGIVGTFESGPGTATGNENIVVVCEGVVERLYTLFEVVHRLSATPSSISSSSSSSSATSSNQNTNTSFKHERIETSRENTGDLDVGEEKMHLDISLSEGGDCLKLRILKYQSSSSEALAAPSVYLSLQCPLLSASHHESETAGLKVKEIREHILKSCLNDRAHAISQFQHTHHRLSQMKQLRDDAVTALKKLASIQGAAGDSDGASGNGVAGVVGAGVGGEMVRRELVQRFAVVLNEKKAEIGRLRLLLGHMDLSNSSKQKQVSRDVDGHMDEGDGDGNGDNTDDKGNDGKERTAKPVKRRRKRT